MKARLKEVRKSTGLSQRKFADALGVSLSNIESYEMGRRSPSDAFIQLICTRYGVNETWLRSGDGEMHAPVTREQEIAEITASLIRENNEVRLALQKLFTDMSEEQIMFLYDTAKKWIEDVNKKDRPE